MLPAVRACARRRCPASELKVAQQCGAISPDLDDLANLTSISPTSIDRPSLSPRSRLDLPPSGGSDAFSGTSANPLVGEACRLLVEAGGAALLAETDELIGAEQYVLQVCTLCTSAPSAPPHPLHLGSHCTLCALCTWHPLHPLHPLSGPHPRQNVRDYETAEAFLALVARFQRCYTSLPNSPLTLATPSYPCYTLLTLAYTFLTGTPPRTTAPPRATRAAATCTAACTTSRSSRSAPR